MHTDRYGKGCQISAPVFPKKSDQEYPDFDPIQLPEFEDAQDVQSELDAAEKALFKYKKVLEYINMADALTDGIGTNDLLYDLMTEHDSVPTYEDCTIDVISHVKAHINVQIAKFTHYVKQLEIEHKHYLSEQRRIEKYGTYEDEVRSYFYKTR